MLTRFLSVIVIGMLFEVGAFAYVNRDTLALTTDWPIWSRVKPTFQERAEHVLTHSTKVTRKQVETIAMEARALGLPALEAQALEAYSRQQPHDRALSLRLADAYRRAGDLKNAERVYLNIVHDTTETR